MIGTFLYVNGSLVDLDQKSPFALTVQRLDVGDLSARFISRTNRFRAPLTENNTKIFEASQFESSATSVPYSVLSCKLIMNGIEVTSMTRCIVNSVDENGYSLTIYERSFDTFSAVEGKQVTDIGAIATSAWNAAAIDAARLNTNGIVTAVMYWGKPTALYQYDYFLPCFYYHTIVKSILEYTGLTLSGDILTDSRFTDLVIPYWGDKFEYDSRYDYLNALGTADTTQFFGIVDPSGDFTGITVELPTIVYGFDNWSFSEYTVSSNGAGVNLTITVRINFTITDWSDATFVRAIIAVNNADSGTGYTVTNPATASGDQEFILTADFNDGDVIKISFNTDASMSDVGISVASASLRVDVNSTVNRDSVNWNALLGDLSCSDVLSDFFTRFSIIHKQQDGVLYLKTLESIINERENAVDWSDKLAKQRIDPIDFSSDYARENYFRFQDPEEFSEETLGRGSLSIDNNTLEEETDFFESIFQKSGIFFVGSFRVAEVPVFNSASTSIVEFEIDPGPRLLTLKDRTGEDPITFNATPRTDYKLAYFNDPQQTKQTSWSYFLEQFYPSISAALQKNKTITKYFILTSTDIAVYDPFKLIYDGHGYYIVNKISNFIEGIPTKVELFKVA